MKYFIIVVIFLGGCSTSTTTVTQVLPTGKDTYIVSAKGGSAIWDQDEMEAVITKANEFCASKGQVATINATNTNGVPGWTVIHSTVQFTCSDLAHQNPSILRPDNGITTAK